MTNLLRHLARRHWRFVLASAGILGGFEFVVCAAVKTFNVGSAIDEIIKSAPPMVTAMLGEQLGSLQGILVFGWNHPVAHAAAAAVAIVLGSRAIAGEIDQGSIELLMSQPISRSSYYSAHLIFGLVSLLLLTTIGLAGTVAGQSVFNLGAFPIRNVLLMGVNFWLLQLTWFALTLALSAFSRESGRIASAAFFVALIAYLVRAIGDAWAPTRALLPYSLYTYYSPRVTLLEQSLRVGSFALLATVTTIAAGIAAWQFARRDLP